MEQQKERGQVDAQVDKMAIVDHWYTINGLSGTPRKEIIDLIARYFENKKEDVLKIADPQGSSYGKLANEIIVRHHVEVSAFTEALLYLTCSKEIFDKVDWRKKQVILSQGSFLETFGYQNQLADWPLEDAKDFFFFFMRQINASLPKLSIVLTENYQVAEKRAGEQFEYKEKEAKYIQDSNRFLQIKAHPILQGLGIKIVNIEVKGRVPQEIFQKEIKPILDALNKD